MKKAFTLVELLVVVLIIGILASVALPQYRTAVMKTRLSTVFAMTKALKEAEEIYYLVNDKYTSDFDELSVTIPNLKNISGQTANTSDGYSYSLLAAGRHDGKRVVGTAPGKGQIYMMLNRSDAPGLAECYTPNGASPGRDTVYDRACRAIGGVFYEMGGDGTARVYRINL